MHVEIDEVYTSTKFGGRGLWFQRYCYFSDLAKFPLWTIMGVKKQNRLKKSMQVEAGVKCTQTNFGVHGLFGFWRFCPFFNCLQNSLNFPSDHGLQSMGVKKLNRLESAQKFHASRGGCVMHVHQLWWAWLLWFQNYGSFLIAFKNSQNFPSDHGLQSMGVTKLNQLKKFMQIEVDVKCMQINFGGHGLSGFGDFVPF